jgi:autotransporter-associated beta strand protein
VSTVFDTFSLLGMTPTPLTFTWSTNMTGAAIDGAGAWDNSTAHWTGSNNTHAVWSSVLGDTAVFGAGGTAGTVTLDAGGITAGGLIFNAGVTGAYMLTGGPLLLTNAPVIRVDAPAQIASQISGTAGFSKTGAATLILSGSNTYSGVMAIETGTVKLVKQSLTIPPPTLWLDASNISTLATNANGTGAISVSGQPVGYWGDLSGNNKSAIQTNNINRPTYTNTVAEFNGRSVLLFDGVNDDLTSLLDINATNIQNMTVIMVYRQVAKTANGGLWGHDNGNWDRLQLLNFTAGAQYDGYPISTYNSRTPVKGMSTNAVLIYSAVLKNGVANSSYVYINGLSDSNNGLPAFTSQEYDSGPASFTLGKIGPGNTYYPGNIQLGEVLVYDIALSDATRVNVESYLRSKWLGAPEPSATILPANSAVRVAAGAALDLGGMEQAVASVSGSGTLSNGTLTVTETLAPGNTNAIGMLTLPGSPIVNGATLMVDVVPNGSSDRLVVAGDLSLSDLSLQLANPGLLSAWRRYTLLTCSGTLTGEFLTNLPENWTIRYDRTAGTVTLYYPNSGTLINLM